MPLDVKPVSVGMTPEKVRSWVYWLQDAAPARIMTSPFNLAVIDYSRDGRDRTAYTRDEIDSMQKAGKIVLCYFSIGEAERYRFYWNKSWDKTQPDFLGPENPDWDGNYKVRFWKKDWWDVALKPYLDRILKAGFNGVYLDIVDGYWWWGDREGNLEQRADQMIALVQKIKAYGQRVNPDFMVCIQNGLAVIDDCTDGEEFALFRSVDFVAVESLFYNTSGKANERYRLGLVRKFAERGKPVLSVEYIPLRKAEEYRRKAAAANAGIIPYRATKDASLKSVATQRK